MSATGLIRPPAPQETPLLRPELDVHGAAAVKIIPTEVARARARLAKVVQRTVERHMRSPSRGTLAAGALGMDHPPLPGFVRVVVTCRACGWQDVLDLQISVEELRRVWLGCDVCGKPDIEIEVIADGGRR